MSTEDFATVAMQRQREGFTHVCIHCGAGVDGAGIGDHAADCQRGPRTEEEIVWALFGGKYDNWKVADLKALLGIEDAAA